MLYPHDEEVEGLAAAVDELVIDFDDDDEHEGSTLVGGDWSYVKEKEVDIEVTDDEEDERSGVEACGVKRKRTIRVVIRSRAFL
jgi:hypothetical protein